MTAPARRSGLVAARRLRFVAPVALVAALVASAPGSEPVPASVDTAVVDRAVVDTASVDTALVDTASGDVRSAGSPVRGRFAGQIDIGGGRKLYLRCAGTGSPTVILESGIHDSSDPWTLTDTQPPVVPAPPAFEGIARFTHVCMYDRPGTIRYTNPPALSARSTPVRMPRELPGMAGDLRRLLARAGVRAPVVLVAHSFGGLIARLFAQTYPRQTAGMVLVDAFGADIKRLFGPRLWPRYVRLLNRPGTPLDSQPGFETINVDGAIRAIARAKPLPRIPLAVISKTRPFATAPGAPKDLTSKLETVWPEVQALQVRLEPQTPHILATGSDHYVQNRDPDLTTGVVRLIVERARHRGASASIAASGLRVPRRRP